MSKKKKVSTKSKTIADQIIKANKFTFEFDKKHNLILHCIKHLPNRNIVHSVTIPAKIITQMKKSDRKFVTDYSHDHVVKALQVSHIDKKEGRTKNTGYEPCINRISQAINRPEFQTQKNQVVAGIRYHLGKKVNVKKAKKVKK